MTPFEPDIEKYLVLSTAHMPSEAPLRDDEASFDAFEYGLYVYVPDDAGSRDEAPKWLRPILWYANQVGCRWIKFDCDARIYPMFREYDWS